jgi:hypothetical protein
VVRWGAKVCVPSQGIPGAFVSGADTLFCLAPLTGSARQRGDSNGTARRTKWIRIDGTAARGHLGNAFRMQAT